MPDVVQAVQVQVAGHVAEAHVEIDDRDLRIGAPGGEGVPAIHRDRCRANASLRRVDRRDRPTNRGGAPLALETQQRDFELGGHGR